MSLERAKREWAREQSTLALLDEILADVAPGPAPSLHDLFEGYELKGDTERGPLDGIGMAAACPTGTPAEAKDRRQLFRFLSPTKQGDRFVGPGYVYRGNERVKTSRYARWS